MKKRIRRLFGLADDQLKRKKTKISGWVFVFLGCTFIVGSIVVYLSFMPMANNWEWQIQRCIQHLKLDSGIPQHNLTIQRATRILDSLSTDVTHHVTTLVAFIFLFGMLFAHYGILCLKLHSILNKRYLSSNENETSSQIHPPITENNTMNHEDTKTSIASSLRKLILILAIPSVVFSAFLIFLMGFMTYTSKRTVESYEEARTVEVVVAKTNLVAGAVLGYDNLGVKRFTQSKLQTKDYVIEDHGYVLVGHRIKKPLEINEPLTWHNTDIVFTNKVSRQP